MDKNKIKRSFNAHAASMMESAICRRVLKSGCSIKSLELCPQHTGYRTGTGISRSAWSAVPRIHTGCDWPGMLLVARTKAEATAAPFPVLSMRSEFLPYRVVLDLVVPSAYQCLMIEGCVRELSECCHWGRLLLYHPRSSTSLSSGFLRHSFHTRETGLPPFTNLSGMRPAGYP